jgi:RNA polymerase sigma-70 factor (ECF subfamily)
MYEEIVIVMWRRGGDTKEIGKDEDREFVLRCQKGDVEAFSTLVERHQKKMLNVAYRMTGDYEDACDCVQEAFLAAYRGIGKFRREARFSSWLYGIVVNHTRNRLRQVKSRRCHEGTIAGNSTGGEASWGDSEATPPRESVADQWERKELEARVQACIGGLDEDFREVLVLKDIQDLSYEEIRDALHIPTGTVKSRLFRARLALKDRLLKVLGDFR